jgi:hypothetical protein
MADAPTADNAETYGVLVGWSHHAFQDKLDVRLQVVQSTRKLERDEIDAHHVVMTREQAAVLANYLFKVSGHTPPGPRKGLLARWFGS